MDFMTEFEKLKKEFINADVSSVKEHVAYQFNVVGDGEGIFYSEISNGKLSIEPYDYRDRDVIFTATWQIFNDIINKKTDAVDAVTENNMQVEGNIDKALLLQDMLRKQ